MIFIGRLTHLISQPSKIYRLTGTVSPTEPRIKTLG